MSQNRILFFLAIWHYFTAFSLSKINQVFFCKFFTYILIYKCNIWVCIYLRGYWFTNVKSVYGYKDKNGFFVSVGMYMSIHMDRYMLLGIFLSCIQICQKHSLVWNFKKIIKKNSSSIIALSISVFLAYVPVVCLHCHL